MVYDVGADPSDEVKEVMTEPDFPIRDPEDESMKRSLAGVVSIAA